VSQSGNTTRTRSRAPGPSGVGYRLVKWVHEAVGEELLATVNASFRLGHVPPCWKAELLVPVPKPRKSDMSSPRSYRPVSLIETFSKLGEKMLATRMQLDNLAHQLLPNNQFGGLLHVGTSDAGLALVHDVQNAWGRGEFCAALAIDIQQFFPSINHKRLLHVAHLLGYPPEVTQWLASFLTDRTFSFRLGDTTTEPTTFHGRGIPQGSPLSPILAATYVAHAMDMPDVQVYVDDGVVKAYDRDAAVAARRAGEACTTVEGRLNLIGLGVDHGEKLEGIIFATAKMRHNVTVIRVDHPDGTHTLVAPAQEWRYLGIFFTPRLSWGAHVKRCKLKGIAMARACRMLANCSRGLALAHARTAYLMAIRPLITYGSPVWYTGRRQDKLVQDLQVAQNEGLRWILGAFRTSPAEDMHHLASIPPIKYVLDQYSTNASTRLHTIGANHGLNQRLRRIAAERPLARTALTDLRLRSADVVETIEPALAVPGDDDPRFERTLDDTVTEQLIRCHKRDVNTLTVYSDGSLYVRGGFRRVGAGALVTHKGANVITRKWPCGSRAEVYDAEMIGLAGASAKALSSCRQCQSV
jgi:hypothetical protein